MDGEVGAAVWIPIAASVIIGLGVALWKTFAKDIDRVEKHTKDEIARVDKRIDDHRTDQIKLHERTAVNESELKRMKEEIGDHDTGLRGWLHDIANKVNPVVQWFTARDRWKDDK